MIAENKITKIVSFSPKFIVLACNTLSTAILNDYSNFCVKVFGVLPVVPPNKKTLLIATKATANSDYVKRIIKNKDADVISAEGLADEIERWVVGGKKPDIAERFKDTYKNYDVVSLGCTHYTLLKDEFSKVFPFSTICDGGDVTFEKIKGLLPTIQHAEQKGSVIFFNKKDEEWFYRLNREF